MPRSQSGKAQDFDSCIPLVRIQPRQPKIGGNMNNELFTIRPTLKQYYGRTITKDTKFDEYTDDKTIHQTLENLVLTTTITRESEYGGIKSKEKSILTQELKENMVLIWNESDGYIIPNREVYKLKDLEKEIEEVKKIYEDNTDINPK